MTKALSPAPNDPVKTILNAKSGDEAAVKELLGLYQPMIEAAVRKYSDRDGFSEDPEDLRQEATIAFCRAVQSFDPEQNEVTFGLYAKICVCNSLTSFRRKQEGQNRLLPLPDDPDIDIGAHEDPGARLLEEEAYRTLARTVSETLSDYENKVWRLFLSGLTAKEIARISGKDEKSINNAIFRIRRKLREVIPHP